MKIKLNPNQYGGPRKAFNIPGIANVRRIYIWDKRKQRYVDPPSANKFEARRLSKVVGKRVTKTFKCLQEAREWLNSGYLDSKLSKIGEDYTIGDLVQDWQRLAWGTLARNTKIYYASRLPMFEPLDAIKVEELSPHHIDEWLCELKQPKWMDQYSRARTTLGKEFELLKTIVSWYLDKNDSTKLVRPFKKRHSQALRIRPQRAKPRKVMYEHELAAWLAELRKESFLFYAMAVVQVSQVLRISEASAMKWTNLSLAQREYTVAEHVIWPRVNGAPPEILPGTKTNKTGDGFVSFLQLETIKVLSELQEMGQKGDLIFTLDGSPLTYRQIQHSYDSAFLRAGLPFRGTHVCRHSGATSFLDKTGDVLALQQMGGWATHKMALHYAKISSNRAKEATLRAERKTAHLKLIRDENGA